MAYLLRKRGKYYAGHSYATGLGHRFSWSANIAEAIRIADDDLERFQLVINLTGAKPMQTPNKRAELKAMAKRKLKP